MTDSNHIWKGNPEIARFQSIIAVILIAIVFLSVQALRGLEGGYSFTESFLFVLTIATVLIVAFFLAFRKHIMKKKIAYKIEIDKRHQCIYFYYRRYGVIKYTEIPFEKLRYQFIQDRGYKGLVFYVVLPRTKRKDIERKYLTVFGTFLGLGWSSKKVNEICDVLENIKLRKSKNQELPTLLELLV